MNILSLNTQKGYHPTLSAFLRDTLNSNKYDFLLLQEAIPAVRAMVQGIPTYSVLEIAGKETQLAIVYRSTFTLKQSALEVFESLHPSPYPYPPAYGVLLGTFEVGNTTVQIGSVHLHSGMRPQMRRAQLLRLEKRIAQERIPGGLTLFGGDFNFGLMGEIENARKIFTPAFSLITNELGPTLDSRYSEPYPNITNTVATFLGRFGVSLKFRTDHFFVDTETRKRVNLSCGILPNRVSDHSPVELSLG